MTFRAQGLVVTEVLHLTPLQRAIALPFMYK